jgi:hypothetical protein
LFFHYGPPQIFLINTSTRSRDDNLNNFLYFSSVQLARLYLFQDFFRRPFFGLHLLVHLRNRTIVSQSQFIISKNPVSIVLEKIRGFLTLFLRIQYHLPSPAFVILPVFYPTNRIPPARSSVDQVYTFTLNGYTNSAHCENQFQKDVHPANSLN